MSVAAAFTAFLTLLLPHAHADAAVAAHFSMRLHETFDAGINPARWGTYTGQPGGNPYGYWKPSHVVPYRGAALLRGYRDGGRYVTGGMMNYSLAQTYGKYVVRAKFDRTNSNIEHCLLLWPTSGWPPEVDFSEGPNSLGTMATSHWGTNNSQIHAYKKLDMSKWHTYGVEWTPTRLLYTIDGVGWAVMTGAAVPKQPMRLAIQTAAVGPVPSTLGENRLSVSDVAIFSYR